MNLFDLLKSRKSMTKTDYTGVASWTPEPISNEEYQARRKVENAALEARYDLTCAEGIKAIPASASLHRGDGISTYTSDIDYYLQRKGREYETSGNIELAILCLKKSNEIRMFCKNGYRRSDYYNLVGLLARTGRISEAKSEKERIDTYFSSFPGWDCDSELCIPENMVKRVVDSANMLHTDLVIMDVHENACSECAKYQGRVFSLTGRDRRFPKMPDVFWKYGAIHPGCGHSFQPFIYGETDPDLKYTLSIQRGVRWWHTRNIVAYSYRPFVDDRPQSDVEAARSLFAKRKEETELQQNRWDHFIEVEAERGSDARNFAWLQKNLPEVCPKSFSGYRRMKSQNTRNFQKLASAAKNYGIDLWQGKKAEG